MKDSLMYIVSQIVDHPDKIEIEEKKEDGIISFYISVDSEDMGKIIGKEGKIIRAIRNVMKIPANKQGEKINVSLVEK